MPLPPLPHVRGLVLAAGAGRRMGAPKALLRGPDGATLVEGAVRVLLGGGCEGVTVVVGAEGSAVRAIIEALPDALPRGMPDAACPGMPHGIPAAVDVVECPTWHEGMGASLRTGLGAIRDRADLGDVDAVLVTLVDLPDVTSAVVARLLARGAGSAGPRQVLRRAAYRGTPGHPALIGRDLWDETVATAVGDRGAREVYRTHPHDLVECGDLGTGEDVDTREAAARWGFPSANRPRE